MSKHSVKASSGTQTVDLSHRQHALTAMLPLMYIRLTIKQFPFGDFSDHVYDIYRTAFSNYSFSCIFCVILYHFLLSFALLRFTLIFVSFAEFAIVMSSLWPYLKRVG